MCVPPPVFARARGADHGVVASSHPGRSREDKRGTVDDALGEFSLSMIDSLDALAVFGRWDDFEDAVWKVADHVSFDNNVKVSGFA